MKKFTIVSSLLFVLLFCGMVGYVASSEDFTPPKEEEEAVVPEEEDREAPVWNTTVDELVSFLEEKGLIHADSKVTLSAEGLCTLALKYDGAEIYWWDLENLAPESDEYQAYESLRTKGEIDLYGSGMTVSYTHLTLPTNREV